MLSSSLSLLFCSAAASAAVVVVVKMLPFQSALNPREITDVMHYHASDI